MPRYSCKIGSVRGSKLDSSQSRAAFSFGINLPTNDPYQASSMMATLSDAGKTSLHPGYHLISAHHPDDWPKLIYQLQHRIAIDAMQELGVADHYAYLVGHEDAKEPHAHLYFERRNPTTGVLWTPDFDYYRLQKLSLELSDQYELRHQVGTLARREGEPWRPRDTVLPLGARRHLGRQLEAYGVERWDDLPRDALPFIMRAQDDLKETLFSRADLGEQNWDKLLTTLLRHSYYLIDHPRGLVLTNGREHIAASRVSRYASRPKLEALFGPFSEYLEHLARHGRAYFVPGHGRLLGGGHLEDESGEQRSVLETARRIERTPERDEHGRFVRTSSHAPESHPERDRLKHGSTRGTEPGIHARSDRGEDFRETDNNSADGGNTHNTRRNTDGTDLDRALGNDTERAGIIPDPEHRTSANKLGTSRDKPEHPDAGTDPVRPGTSRHASAGDSTNPTAEHELSRGDSQDSPDTSGNSGDGATTRGLDEPADRTAEDLRGTPGTPAGERRAGDRTAPEGIAERDSADPPTERDGDEIDSRTLQDHDGDPAEPSQGDGHRNARTEEQRNTTEAEDLARRDGRSSPVGPLDDQSIDPLPTGLDAHPESARGALHRSAGEEGVRGADAPEPGDAPPTPALAGGAAADFDSARFQLIGAEEDAHITDHEQNRTYLLYSKSDATEFIEQLASSTPTLQQVLNKLEGYDQQTRETMGLDPYQNGETIRSLQEILRAAAESYTILERQTQRLKRLAERADKAADQYLQQLNETFGTEAAAAFKRTPQPGTPKERTEFIHLLRNDPEAIAPLAPTNLIAASTAASKTADIYEYLIEATTERANAKRAAAEIIQQPLTIEISKLITLLGAQRDKAKARLESLRTRAPELWKRLEQPSMNL